MKLSELMAGYTPDANFEGYVTNDDFVLAINTNPNGENITEKDYAVLQLGATGLDSQMNPITQDKQYIRQGQTTLKTGNQRAFVVSGDRYIGDAAQDYIMSHDIKYGTGNAVVTDYVYFCLLTGKGEKGKVSIVVSSDSGGNAGENAAINVELKKVGANPEEYTYSAT